MAAESVLALDTASTLGWAAFHGRRRHASGVVKLKQRTVKGRKDPRAAKYQHVLDVLDLAVEGDGPISLLRRPDVIVIERTGGTFKSKDAVEVTNGIMAAAELWAFQNGIPVALILNWLVKKHATGSTQANKKDMIARAKKLWRGVKLADDNEADALHLGRAYIDGVECKWL